MKRPTLLNRLAGSTGDAREVNAVWCPSKSMDRFAISVAGIELVAMPRERVWLNGELSIRPASNSPIRQLNVDLAIALLGRQVVPREETKHYAGIEILGGRAQRNAVGPVAKGLVGDDFGRLPTCFALRQCEVETLAIGPNCIVSVGEEIGAGTQGGGAGLYVPLKTGKVDASPVGAHHLDLVENGLRQYGRKLTLTLHQGRRVVGRDQKRDDAGRLVVESPGCDIARPSAVRLNDSCRFGERRLGPPATANADIDGHPVGRGLDLVYSSSEKELPISPNRDLRHRNRLPLLNPKRGMLWRRWRCDANHSQNQHANLKDGNAHQRVIGCFALHIVPIVPRPNSVRSSVQKLA